MFLTLLQNSSSGSYVLLADGGSYSYSGNDANLLYARILGADGGAFAYSGNDATLVYTPAGAYTLVADGATYSYSGNEANVLFSRLVNADGGTFTYAGNNASLTYTPSGAFTLQADGGSYSYSGNNAELVYTPLNAFVLLADGGVFSYIGNNAILTFSGEPAAIGGGGPSAKRGWAREREILEQSLKEVSVKSIANTMASAGQQPATKIAKKLEDYSGEIEQIEALKKELSRLESVKLKKKLDEDKRADIQRAADDLQRMLKDDEDVFYAMSAVEELEKQIILSIFRLH